MPELESARLSPADPDARAGWRALLIGINRFLHVGNLEGALEDVARAETFARYGLGIAAGNITILRDAEATREAVIGALWALGDAPLKPDDQVLIHVSSHGTLMVDPLDESPTGKVECLVVHDSGPGGGWHISDRTLGALIDRISRKTPNVTVVLDCCHSSSQTRFHDVRLTKPDGREPPADLDAEIRAEAERPKDGEMRHTVLAACRARQLAFEYEERLEDRVVKCGLFSHFLYRALRTATDDMSYRLLMEQVAARVGLVKGSLQQPQCEGRRDRAIFGGHDVRIDAFVSVIDRRASGLVLDGGEIFGLRIGDRLELYPPELNSMRQLEWVRGRPERIEPIGFATVTAVEPTTCRARFEPLEGGPEQPPLHARALRVHPPTDGGRVRFEVLPGAQPLGDPPDDAQWQIAPPGEAADMHVVVGRDTIEVFDAAGQPRVAPQPRGRWAWSALSIMARFDRLARLHNPEPGSALQDGFELRLRRHVDADLAVDNPVVEATGGRVVLPYDPDGPPAKYITEVVNRSGLPAETQVLLLNGDFSVIPLYPVQRAPKRLAPGRSLFVGHRFNVEAIDVWLPGDQPGEPLWVRSRNIVLLIASQKSFNAELLRQPGIDGAPPRTRGVRGDLAALLLDCARGTRMLRRRVPEDWGVARLHVDVVRRPEAVALASGALSIGVQLTCAGLTGTVTAASHERMTVFEPLVEPPLAALQLDGLEPIPSPMPDEGPSPLILRFDAQAAPDASLTVEVPGESAPLVPVAFDRRGYTVLGQPAEPGVAQFLLGAAKLDRPFLLARRT